MESGEKQLAPQPIPNRNPIRLTQARVRVTARSRQFDPPCCTAESGQSATEIAAPTSKTNIIQQRSRNEIHEMRMEARSEVSGWEQRSSIGSGSRNWRPQPGAVHAGFPSLSQFIVGEPEAVSRVRSAARKTRALDTASDSPEDPPGRKRREQIAMG